MGKTVTYSNGAFTITHEDGHTSTQPFQGGVPMNLQPDGTDAAVVKAADGTNLLRFDGAAKTVTVGDGVTLK